MEDVPWGLVAIFFIIAAVMAAIVFLVGAALAVVFCALAVIGWLLLLIGDWFMGATLFPQAPWIAWLIAGGLIGAALGYWTIAPVYGHRKQRPKIVALPFALILCFGLVGAIVGKTSWDQPGGSLAVTHESSPPWKQLLPRDPNGVTIAYVPRDDWRTYSADQVDANELSEANQHLVSGDELTLPSSEWVTIYIISKQPIGSADFTKSDRGAFKLIPYESDADGQKLYWVRTWGSVTSFSGAELVIRRGFQTKTVRLVKADFASTTLAGTWHGSHSAILNALLKLHESESMGVDVAYGGTITGTENGKSITIDVDVEFRRATGGVTITEAAVHGDSDWSLGVNTGIMAGPNSMSGTGNDNRGTHYEWSYSRN